MTDATGKSRVTRHCNQPAFFHTLPLMRAIHSDSGTSSGESTDGDSDTPAPALTPDDYTTVPSTHPSQQLLKASLFSLLPIDLQAANIRNLVTARILCHQDTPGISTKDYRSSALEAVPHCQCVSLFRSTGGKGVDAPEAAGASGCRVGSSCRDAAQG